MAVEGLKSVTVGGSGKTARVGLTVSVRIWGHAHKDLLLTALTAPKGTTLLTVDGLLIKNKQLIE
jgi:hypothetical protein